MDTNVKKFKYSLFNKVLCIVLSVLCFIGSVSLAATSLVSTEYLSGFDNWDKIMESEFYDSAYFVNNLRDDLQTAVSYAEAGIKKEDLKTILQSKKDEAVEKGYKQLLQWKSANDAVLQENEEYADDGTVYTTMTQDEISVFVASYDGNDYYFSFFPNTVRENAGYSATNYKDEIAYEYDIFVSDNVSIYDTEYTPYRYENSLNLSVKYGKYTAGNSEISRSDALGSDIYLYYADGEFLYGGISEETAQYIFNACISDDMKDDVSFCLYFNTFPESDMLFFNPNLWNDKYSSLMTFHRLALGFECNRGLVVTLTVALMIVSVICAFYYFSITGRKKQDEKANLILTDKIPLDIHFIISAVLGFILAYGVFTVTAWVNFYSIITVFLCGLLALVIWAVLFELCSSVARITHSNRKIGKNLAVVKTSKGFVRLCRKIKTGIKQGVLNAVRTIAYKPRQLKAYTFAMVGGYVFVNCILILLMIAVRDSGSTFLFTGFVFFILNAVVIWRVLKFMKYLDEIISSAKNGETFKGNREKLPSVLKVLAESLENTNEQLKIAVDKAVKDERLKTELITNVSHDLKTPLTSIISYVDLLSKCDIQDEKAKEYIGVLEDKGGKLKRLIEDLIEASKVTSGNITVNPTSLNLNELCLQAIGENQSEFEKNGLEIIADESEKSPIIFADGSKTFRIFENLLSNARKYSAQPSRVYVSTYVEGNMGVFEIKNISAEPLNISPDELTERFVRGDKSRTKEGNGLGLSIAKELCTAQGGKLEIIIDGDLFKARVKLPLAK